MKIYQILPTLSYGDGVSNDCIAIRDRLLKNGYKTEIYAENIDKRLPPKLARHFYKLPKIKDDDIVLYHLSTGTNLNKKMLQINGKKILRYHNITPPAYFMEYNIGAYSLCRQGYQEAELLAKKFSYLLADSEYNRQEFVKMGFQGTSEVAPILIPFEDYEKPSNKQVELKYTAGKGKNIVFVGRLSPNKKQERLIEIFYYYKKHYDSDAKLFLVGSGKGMELYEEQLKEYARKLELTDIHFTGHVKFDEILAYYKLADTFVCMSEHEGFCIPLVEAMFFHVPVVALNTSAIGGTLNGAGVLIDQYNALEIAGVLNKLNTDTELRNNVLENQNERLLDFAADKTFHTILDYIKRVQSGS